VTRADRLPHDDVTGDQLEPLVVGEDAGLAHPVIFVHGEPAPVQHLGHRSPLGTHSTIR